MKVGTITVFMIDAYDNDQLNEVQTKTWENIVNKIKNSGQKR